MKLVITNPVIEILRIFIILFCRIKKKRHSIVFENYNLVLQVADINIKIAVFAKFNSIFN